MSDTPPSDFGQKVFTIDTEAKVPRGGSTVNKEARTNRTKHDQRKNKLEDLFMKIATGIFVANQFDGYCVIGQAPQLAEALADAADTNTALAKMIDNLNIAGGYAAIFGALAAMLAPIAAYHGLIPKQFGGSVIEMMAPEEAKAVLAVQIREHAERMAQQGGSTAA